MSDDKALALQAAMGGAVQVFDDTVFDKLAAASYLPRLVLGDFNSTPVKERKLVAGDYGFIPSKTVCQDLGDAVDILVLAWQPKAVRFEGSTLKEQSTDHNSAVFKQIQIESDISDSGCQWGFEFLVYVPSIKQFATYFMSSKTSRQEARNLKPLMHKPATLKSQLIKGKKNQSWYGPLIFPCSTPFEYPSTEDIQAAAQKFQAKPPASRTEKVEASGRES
jgi:hypothetical protein